MPKDLYLVLSNGKIFKGEAFGFDGEAQGEVVFNTSMVGYLETLTDKVYDGQIVVQTFPSLGNYGVISDDLLNSKAYLNGYIVHEHCSEPSNFRSEGDLDTFLKKQRVVGLSGIDTRALTRILRDEGVMKGFLTKDPKKIESQSPSPYLTDEKVVIAKDSNSLYSIAVINTGINKNILDELIKRGCAVTLFPIDTTADEIINSSPDAVLLPEGAGAPTKYGKVIECIAELVKAKLPMLGIGLGHQLLAISMGFKTSKLKYGHRGANQPVKDLKTDRIYITNQNHGYIVLSESIDEKIATVNYINVNDGTCEGISYKNIPAFSVQFLPQSSDCPQDMSRIFDEFIELIKK